MQLESRAAYQAQQPSSGRQAARLAAYHPISGVKRGARARIWSGRELLRPQAADQRAAGMARVRSIAQAPGCMFTGMEFDGIMSSTYGKGASSVGEVSEQSLTCLMSSTAGRKAPVGVGRVCMQKVTLGESIPVRPFGRGGVKEYV